MEIKEFLQLPEIQALLSDNDLYPIYETVQYNYRSDLTKFFLENNINPLDYMNEICDKMYYTLDITSIFIPNNIKYIGYAAFSNCRNLINITISNSVKVIYSDAFINCQSLLSIIIPESVKSIGERAFYNCKNLQIKCKENSVAHNYAIKNNIKFELI